MLKKMIAIFVVCLGLLALMPNGSSENGVLQYHWNNSRCTPGALIQNETDFALIISTDICYISNISKEQHRLIISIGTFDAEFSEIINMTMEFSIHNIQVAGNISVHTITGGQSNKLVTWNTNWTHGNRNIGVAYVNPGCDYDTTPLDTQYIDVGAQVYTFDITEYLNTSNQHGLIFIADSGTNISIQGFSSSYPMWYIRYSAGSGQSTNLYEDVWNLKGYAGASPKLASTILSEITNCTALSWKNATSGYWYTYWPGIGFTEDEHLNYGDGLFILVDADTTWDHV